MTQPTTFSMPPPTAQPMTAPMVLPTDTQHLLLETRQYELFHLRLGQGVPRRRIWWAVAACVVWWPLLVLAGVSPLSALGPAMFVVPPFVLVFAGSAVGDDGRMRAMRWYDAALARLPRRRRPLRNPLLPARPRVVRLQIRVSTELRPGPAAQLAPAAEPSGPAVGRGWAAGGGW